MNSFCSGVYLIKNTISNNVYVGSTRLFKRRFAQHITALNKGSHQNKHLQAAWNKYGKEAFNIAVYIICAPEQVQFYEQRAINILKPIYNQSKSAYSGIPSGTKLSSGHKAKVGRASKIAWATQSYRDKVTTAINKAMTKEEKLNRSARTKKLWENEEYRAKSIASRKGNAWNKGYKCTPEQIENRRRAARISNMKRNYGVLWKEEYIRRYPEYKGDVNA